jgi:hypothetical protein
MAGRVRSLRALEHGWRERTSMLVAVQAHSVSKRFGAQVYVRVRPREIRGFDRPDAANVLGQDEPVVLACGCLGDRVPKSHPS